MTHVSAMLAGVAIIQATTLAPASTAAPNTTTGANHVHHTFRTKPEQVVGVCGNDYRLQAYLLSVRHTTLFIKH